jgi:alkanesulfonate monooxygenase SsuD/methylene tetrahydromethanopterin reductase-like flavin-dependent oxidoreductase (luciferase family)
MAVAECKDDAWVARGAADHRQIVRGDRSAAHPLRAAGLVELAVQLALLDNLSKGRIDVGVGKGTIYNEYEFVGHGLRSDDSRERVEEAIDIIGRLWGGGPVTYSGKYFQVQVPQLRPRPVQRPQLPLWRSVISPASFSECGRLGVPILTARLPVARIKERWAAYEAGLDAGGHDAETKARLLAQSALWRNVYVADPVRRRRTSCPGCCCTRAPT